MDKEIEDKINEILDSIARIFLHKIRDNCGEFPYRIRFDLFFRKEDGSSHFLERDIILGKEQLDLAEELYQEYIKAEIIKKASDILKGLDL